jgi:ABC-type transporter Mla maintaining outer membrane lipid asymmetry ATPase subunit MlaF
MQNKVIQVKGLQKSYKKLQVLKGVDLEVEKGSIFALLGSNGLNQLLERLKKEWSVKYVSISIKPYEKL